MATGQPLIPCLWFDGQAEDAARFYTGIFKNSKIGTISRFTEVGHDIHGRPAGSVMTVEFELNGQPFTALNGGPQFKFNEAISFQRSITTGTDSRKAEIPRPSSAAGSRTGSASRGRWSRLYYSKC